MKSFLLALILSLVSFKSNAQNRTADSLKNLLTTTTEPVARFHLIDKLLETVNSTVGGIDSANCIELLKTAQHQKDDGLLAISYNWISAYFLITKGDNATALEYCFKALPLAKKTNDKRRISSIYFDISVIYRFLQNYDEMLKYNLRGKDNLPDQTHPLYYYMLAQYQRNMATYFINVNKPDSALHYAQALMETSRRANASYLEFSGMHLTGASFAALGEKDLAEIYFNKALAVSETITNNSGKLGFNINYIPFLLNNKRYSEAKKQADLLLRLGKQNNNNNLMLAGARYMRQVFDATQNMDSAYYFSRMETDINAKIFNQDNTNKIQAMAFNDQIRSMEEEAKQVDTERQRKQNIQYALLALSIITFVILFLAFSRRHITNTKVIQFLGIVALLVVFEFLNLLLHPFLERITNHNPILMLLALVCIAALLVPLHHRLEKWATHKLVEKNKQVRLAAAKKTIQELEEKPNDKLD
jgi:tetratricopeptide (TPR) repeat protein